jgi:hypothetical protein
MEEMSKVLEYTVFVLYVLWIQILGNQGIFGSGKSKHSDNMIKNKARNHHKNVNRTQKATTVEGVPTTLKALTSQRLIVLSLKLCNHE